MLNDVYELEKLIAGTARARSEYRKTEARMAGIIYGMWYLALGRRALHPQRAEILSPLAMHAMFQLAIDVA